MQNSLPWSDSILEDNHVKGSFWKGLLLHASVECTPASTAPLEWIFSTGGETTLGRCDFPDKWEAVLVSKAARNDKMWLILSSVQGAYPKVKNNIHR